MGRTVEWQFEMGYMLEFRVAFVVRIDEVLDLSHLELPHSDQAVSWGDLVSESETDLGCSEGQSSSIELQQFVEVYEHSLGCFGPQVAN